MQMIHRDNASRRKRALRLSLFLAGLFCLAAALRASGVAFNLTDSMPVGFYHVGALVGDVRAGQIVRVCVPPSIAALGISRGYLSKTSLGGCPGEVAPMLKIVAAVHGDVVDVTPDAVLIDGHALPGSRTFARDSRGLPLPHVAYGKYRLGAGKLWLWTPNPRSWDSRYYGALDAKLVLGSATLVLALGDWPFVDRAHRL